MANYLEVRNEQRSVIIGDDYPILQPMRSEVFEVAPTTVSTFSNTGVIQRFGTYYYLGEQASIHVLDAGWEVNTSDFSVMRLYYPGVTSTAMPEARAVFSTATRMYVEAFDTRTIRVHKVTLSHRRRETPVDESALVAYDENSELVFDSALGTAHLLKNISVQPGLGAGDKYIEVGDFTGYDLDFSKVFFRIESFLYKSLSEYSNGGLGYRVGWYAWMPSIYMDSNQKMWVKLRYFTPHGYGVYESNPISDYFKIQIFYLPSIRTY